MFGDTHNWVLVSTQFHWEQVAINQEYATLGVGESTNQRLGMKNIK